MRSILTALFAFTLITLLPACGGKGRALTSPDTPPGQAMDRLWGEFTLELDAEGTPVLHAADRAGQLIVDPYVRVELLSTVYDPVTRIWDIEAAFTNLTNRTAFGLWVVFFNLNGNRILDQDGFATLPQGGDFNAAPGAGQRKPVVALGKDQERRRFLGGATLKGKLRIQWPQGATNFGGLRFYLDASFPNARQEPIVENLALQPASSGGPLITAFVKDWQSGHDLQVLANVGGVLPVLYPLRDDGEYPDAKAGDDLWTGQLPPLDPGQRVVVRADDPAGFHFENEIFSGGSNVPPCDDNAGPRDFRPFVHGSLSQIHQPQQVVVRNPAEWQQLWSQHQPGSAPPPVNFACHNVYAVFMGSRPTGGFEVHPSLRLHSNLLPELCYSTISPGEKCIVTMAATAPFRMWLGPKLNAVSWLGSQRINECLPGNVPFYTLFRGSSYMTEQPERQELLQGEDQYHGLWNSLQLPHPIPCVDFDTETVVIVSQGTRSSGGHAARVLDVRVDGPVNPGSPIEQIMVHWEAVSPGANCPVTLALETPVHFGVVPKVPNARWERSNRQAPPCDPPGECQPYTVLLETQFRQSTEPFEQTFVSPNDFVPFWMEHFEGQPPSDINWATEMVIAIGLEQFPSGGHTLALPCLRRVPGSSGTFTYQVEYVHTAPGAHCAVPGVLTQPALVIRAPRATAPPVSFQRENKTAPACDPPPAECQPYQTLYQTFYRKTKEPFEHYFTSPNDLVPFWMAHFEAPVPQDINWATDIVIAIGLEEFSTGGHTIELECLRRLPQPNGGFTYRAEYFHTAPGAGCGVTQAFTQPALIVKAPRPPENPNALVTFERGNRVAPPCDPPPCSDYQVIAFAPQVPEAEPATLVIRTPQQYEQYWVSRYPGSAPPPVNFEEWMVLALNTGTLAVPRYPAIDCIRIPGPGAPTNEPVRVDWHRVMYNQECPFEDGNWGLLVRVPRNPRPVEFIQADDELDECR